VFASLLWTGAVLTATESNPARAPLRKMTATEYWWDVLGTAAEEGEQYLYEPFLLAAFLRDTTPQERVLVAERTLRDLYERDLIYFYRGRPEPNVSLAGDCSDRLTKEEVDRVLADRSWHPRRPGDGYEGDAIAVRLDATEDGVRMFKSAPPEIVAFWRGG